MVAFLQKEHFLLKLK